MALARQARIHRRFDLLQIISNLISALLPDTDLATAAQYYAALCLHRQGRTEEARKQLGRTIELASPAHKSGALLALAHTYYDTGETGEFATVLSEAALAACGVDPLSEIQALRNLAISRALLGDHKAALSMLQSQLPVMREIGYWYPVDLLSHLNSVAIELGELGRTEEANALIDFVLRSPFAEHQREWHDTKAELAAKPQLIFPRFTLALGAPAEDLFVAEAEPDCPARALDGEQDSLSSPARACQTATKRQRAAKQSIVQASSRPAWKATPSIKVAHRASTVSGLTRSGYAVSPPARAPPPT